MTTLQQMASNQASPEVLVNEIGETLSWAGIFGKRHEDTAGLVWGYYGGIWGANDVADGTVTLDASTVNYVVVELATGVVSTDTATTDWDDTGVFGRLYKLTTDATTVTATEDHRLGEGGVHSPLSGVGAAVSQPGEMICGFISAPSNKTYKLVVKAAHGGTITEATTISASGTCTATWKINTTALGGTANSVSSTEDSQAHSSANVFVAGDDIQLTVSSNSACADMSFTLKYTRTLA